MSSSPSPPFLYISNLKTGDMYRYGEGCSISIDKAIVWYQKAIDQGNLYARDKLGTFVIYVSLSFAQFKFELKSLT